MRLTIQIKTSVVMIFMLAVVCVFGNRAESQQKLQVQQEGRIFTAMNMKINDVPVYVEWEDNESAKALREGLPLIVKMSMYGGFEQVGSLGRNLPRNDKRITTHAGDIVLYSGNQIVLFYGANTWAYNKLGRITGKTQSELADLLGKSDAVLTLSAE